MPTSPPTMASPPFDAAGSTQSYTQSQSQRPSSPHSTSSINTTHILPSQPPPSQPFASQSQQQQPPTSNPQQSHHHAAAAGSQAQQRSVKRPRPVKSCTECRKRKLRCDRLLPCSQCQKSSRQCKYSTEQESGNFSDGSDAELSEPSRPMKRNCPPSVATTPTASGFDPPALVVPPPTKNGESSSSGGFPLLEDLSIRMERLEKHVMVRSPATTELSASKISAAPSQTIRGLSIKNNGKKTRYFGQNAPRVMLNLVSFGKINFLL